MYFLGPPLALWYELSSVCLSYLAPLLRYSDRLIAQKSQILPTPSHLAPSFGVTPFEFLEKLYGSWNYIIIESSMQPTVKIWWF